MPTHDRATTARLMSLANRLDEIARGLSYHASAEEGIAKHRLFELVATLGGTGERAASPAPARLAEATRRAPGAARGPG